MVNVRQNEENNNDAIKKICRMIAFEFLNKDTCSKNKIYDELEEVFGTSSKGYVSKRKFNLICKNNLTEDIYKLFKDWISTTRFESMLTPFIYE